MRDVKSLISELRKLDVRLTLHNERIQVEPMQGPLPEALLTEIQESHDQLVAWFKKNVDKAGFNRIRKVPQQDHYAVSSSQQRLWVLSQLDGGSEAYHIPGAFLFDGALEGAALTAAFQSMIERHEILRTVFRTSEQGDLRQYILPAAALNFTINQQDLRKDASRVQEYVQQDFSTPFDLATGPLLRASLYQVEDSRWIFSFVMHHIISDAWSMGVLVRELLAFYQAAVKHEEATLPALPIQYKDYAAWQEEYLKNPSMQSHKAYWLQQFEGELPLLEMPADAPRPPIKTYNGSTVSQRIPLEITQQVKALCQQQGATQFMGLLAAVNALLYKYTGQQDIIIGSPIAGRSHADLEHQIGLYLNTLPLRTRFRDADNYQELLALVKQVTLGAYDHQAYPFDELVNDLSLRHHRSRHPLFDILIDYHEQKSSQPHEKREGGNPGVEVSAYASDNYCVSKFDLTFMFTESDQGLDCSIEYNSDLYQRSTIERMQQHFALLLASIVQGPDKSLAALEYIPAEEKTQLTIDFNNIPASFEGYRSVVQMIAEQVKQRPEAMAVTYKDGNLSYEELDAQSNQLANYLRLTYEVGPGDLVGILMDRSDQLLVAIWAVLKCGSAFVPIDVDYPGPRQEYIIQDTGIKVLLTQSTYMFNVSYYEGILFAMDIQLSVADATTDHPGIIPDPDSLAYIIYTSGSTGLPKGVCVSHGNLSNYIQWANGYYFPAMQAAEPQLPCFGLFTPLSFDLTITPIFCSLTTGGRLHVYPQQEELSAIFTHSFGEESGINSIKLTPSHINFLNGIRLRSASMQLAIVGGEEVTKEHVTALKQIHPAIVIVNEYGPTETTVGCVVKQLQENESILIGRPIAHTAIYILDDHLQLSATGIAGEICIAGAGVAKGYLNKPGLDGSFLANPFRPEEALYRTGDLGRWLPSGELAFLGRKDDQVKIRGYRIETGEVESILQSHPAIVAAAVVARQLNGDGKELIAYLVTRAPINIGLIRTYLGNSLPAYMIPSHYVELDALPLTTNGKINKKLLPAPQGLGMDTGNAYIAPRTETEEKLAALWKEVLELPNHTIGIKDDFFILGGHSLKATRLAGLLYREMNIRLELKDLFTHTLLEAQARVIDQTRKTAFLAIAPAPVQPSYPLSSSQRRLWMLSQIGAGSLAYHITGAFVFEGVLDQPALSNAFDTLIQRHEVLRTLFRQDEQGNPYQVILESGMLGFTITTHDLRNDPTAVQQQVDLEFAAPFYLDKGPLLRASLFQVADTCWIFSFVMHHIISDGWSMNILIKELMANYHQGINAQTSTLPPLRIQYKDYAVWQQDQLHSGALKAQQAYWIQQLEGSSLLELPADRPRPAAKTYNGSALHQFINKEQLDQLKNLGQEQGATLFMGLLSLVNILLHKYSGQTDMVIGSPVAGRAHADLEDQLGFYLNVLALRTKLDKNDSFHTLIQKVKQVTLGAYDHQLYPFDQLVDDLQWQRDRSRHPLFDVLIDLHNHNRNSGASATGGGQDALRLSSYTGGEQRVSKFDLTFLFTETQEGLNLLLEYNSDLFNQSTIESMQQHIAVLLQSVIASPSAPIHQLEYIDQKEKATLLHDLNTSEASFSGYSSVVDLFTQQVRRSPDARALAYGATHLTYAELDARSNQLAHYLKETYEVGVGDLVGILMDRSDQLLIAILGILKSGAAYVPVDVEYPRPRQEYIIQDAGIKVLITQSEYMFDVSYFEGIVFAIDIQLNVTGASTEPLAIEWPAAAVAYIIYTSGSTGLPKGCCITHGNLSNYIQWANNYYFEHEPRPVFGLYTSLSFDLTVTSLFCPLTKGGSLHIYPQKTEFPAILAHSFDPESGINSIKLTPSHIHLIKGLQLPPGILKYAIVGGEEVTREHVSILKQVNPAMRVFNEYGPTETTVGCIVKELQEGEEVLIGRPIANTTVYILDDSLALCALGIPGEICIGGAGVGLGYLNKPELLGQKFIADPFALSGQLYRTGDRGRWMPDGELAFLGRKDEQVKIKGYRIEPGEIISALEAHPDIKAATVTIRREPDGQQALVAYMASDARLQAGSIRAWLSNSLPAYMIPAHYVRLDALPLTPHGKIDKAQLPDPEESSLRTGSVYMAPRNEKEAILVSVFEEVLRKSPVGIRDDFFVLGGDSIKSIQIVSRLKKKGYAAAIHDILVHPIIEDLADAIHPVTRFIDQQRVEGAITLSPIQRYFFQTHSEGQHHFNQSVLLSSRQALIEEAIRAVMDKLLEHHDALRMVFHHNGTTWIQDNKAATTGKLVEVIDTPDDASFRLHCDRLQAGFDLANGPLVKAALLRHPAGDRLLVIVHHLVVDGVSWRILLEDFMTLYNQYIQGEPLTLPLKTDSFQYWMQQQQAYAASPALLQEEPYWNSIPSTASQPLPLAWPQGSNLRKDAVRQSFQLTAAQTEELLTRCYRAYHTEINDILLTALSLALQECFAMDEILLNLEGHGREALDTEVDISRTVGWFTTIYPVAIAVKHPDDAVRQLIEVKETLHRIPNKGIGYGILRYLSGKPYHHQPEITFNYLGDFGAEAPRSNGKKEKEKEKEPGTTSSTFEFSTEYHGRDFTESMSRDSLLGISGMVAKGRIRLTIEYSNRQWSEAVINNLLTRFRQKLENLIEILVAEQQVHISPVDLTYKGLSLEQIQQLNS